RPAPAVQSPVRPGRVHRPLAPRPAHETLLPPIGMKIAPIFAGLVLATGAVAAVMEKAAPRAPDAFAPLPPGAVKIGGRVGAAIDLGLRARVAAQNVDDLIAPFALRRDRTEWRSEFWGKWITSAIAGWRYAGDERLRALEARAVAALIGTQTPDGYIGAYPDGGHLQRWDVWGRKYTLLGLLAWHEATGDAAALAAARREA